MNPLISSCYLPCSALRYSPFGSVMPGREYANGAYRFGFNGKHYDIFFQQYDFGERTYSAHLGRFFTTDPLTYKFAWITPYQFANNNPVYNIDVEGLYAATPQINDESVILLPHDPGPKIEQIGLVNIIEHMSVGRLLQSVYRKIIKKVVEKLIPFIRKQAERFGKFIKRKFEKLGEKFRKWNKDREIRKERRELEIPKDWESKPSKKGDGQVYVDPNNPHNSTRTMPGNPNSPNPAQQKPYVKVQRDGVFYDKNGKPLPNGNSAEAHIPRTEYNPDVIPKTKNKK